MIKTHTPSAVFTDRIFRVAARQAVPERAWLVENFLLIRTAQRNTRDLDRQLRKNPKVIVDGVAVPRVLMVARTYLDQVENTFLEQTFRTFVESYQRDVELEMGEIWALRPCLEYALLERLSQAESRAWSELVSSLRRIGETQWTELFETLNVVDPVLQRDPAGAYVAMDFESRDLYRNAIADLAKHSAKSEREVAEEAVRLAATPTTKRTGHVGYYLVDNGVHALRSAVGYRAPLQVTLRDFIRTYNTGFYLCGVEIVTFLVVASLLWSLDSLTPILAGLLLLLLPATQAAVDFMSNLTSHLIPPKLLPRLDFSKGIPDDCATLVAVPALLLNETQVRELVQDLEIRYLANHDPNLYFALLTDPPDSDKPFDERDKLVDLAISAIERLNQRYGEPGHQPFYLFHRHRIFNEAEGRWMAWERKRGKLLDLNSLLRGGEDRFPVKVGDIANVRRLRYVITLDSDTQLPRDAAHKLAGTMAHPLNRPVIDPASRIIVEGYGILQPRIGVSIQSASRSKLANLYSGQTGFDIYTRAVSDVYQDLFGEGIFTGKGIYDVAALYETLQHRFPENSLLSHDLIEGAHARTALVTDIELIDDYPSHFSAYSRRKHRWVRGDWQILQWLMPSVKQADGTIASNPLSVINRWKIIDNLRRSLFEPATLLLLLAGWFYLPGSPLFWTAASAAMFLMPVYSRLFFSILRAPVNSLRGMRVWAKATAYAFLEGHAMTVISVVFLLHQSLLSLDAIGRSVIRVFVTGKRLLEWETAAESESRAARKATVDVYMEWSPVLAVLVGVALWFIRPEAMQVALPVLIGWLCAPYLSAWLNQPPVSGAARLRDDDRELLRDSAERIWRYFSDWSTEETYWLVPDNVSEDGTAALRFSPTNVGLLLNARIAAVKLGMLSLSDFVHQTLGTLNTIDRLEKHNGHLWNWYDLRALAPLQPRFVSTVDSGNLVACYWTLKQAAIEFAENAPSDERDQLHEIASRCDRLARDTDFRFLLNQKKKVLSVGYDAASGELLPSSYDILASESRIASFVAIAKSDIPQKCWFHLDRRQTMSRGEPVLVSWTGSMFEYLMPALWMRHYGDTILRASMERAVRTQIEYARRKGVPWGISESACEAPQGHDYGYSAFGIPELSVKQMAEDKLVISPYSTMLALLMDLKPAVDNLRKMAAYGWVGRYGFYESVDYTHAGAQVMRLWMVHHLGMSLLALTNVLLDSPFQKYFHSEPHVLATELLLHERVPATAFLGESQALPIPVLEPAPV